MSKITERKTKSAEISHCPKTCLLRNLRKRKKRKEEKKKNQLTEAVTNGLLDRFKLYIAIKY